MNKFYNEIFKIHDPEKQATSVSIQIILLIINLSIIGYLFYNEIYNFESIDLSPNINLIDHKLLTIKTNPSIVKVSLYIYDFNKFDILTNDFIIEALISFEYDPTVLNLDIIDKFSFIRGTILYKSSPRIQIKNNSIFVSYELKVQFKTNLNYRLFPFSSHKINLILENKELYSEEVSFKADTNKFITSQYINLNGWKEYNKQVITGYYKATLQENSKETIYHPVVNFSIEYLNNSIKDIVSIFLPLFLLFFMAVFSFAMDPKFYFTFIVGLSTGSVTGMLAYKYVIDKLSPQVDYFMFSDIVYFVFLAIVIFIFLCNSQAFGLSSKKKVYLTLFVYFVLIFTFIYLIKFWNK